ncbi:protein of exodeoxyribonuclease iii family [Pseudohyphozyma bogoriensis]|nr:protein of exodeoxyribonuclease iii family [Pseudohyphozyma bogoriensis]
MSSSSSALASCSAASTYRPFDDLPAELLRHIFSCLELDYPSLLAATRVSKRWNESATPSLYAQLNVGEWRFQKAQLLSKELDDRPHLRPMVRTLIAQCVEPDALTRSLVDDFATNRESELASEPDVKAAWKRHLQEEKKWLKRDYRKERIYDLDQSFEEYCLEAEDDCWHAFAEGYGEFDVEAFVLKRECGRPQGAWLGLEGWKRAMDAFARLIGMAERLEELHLVGAFDFFDETIDNQVRKVLGGLSSATITSFDGQSVLRYLDDTNLRELNVDTMRVSCDTFSPLPRFLGLRRLRLPGILSSPSIEPIVSMWDTFGASPLHYLDIPITTLAFSVAVPAPAAKPLHTLLGTLKHLHLFIDLGVMVLPLEQKFLEFAVEVFPLATSLRHFSLTTEFSRDLSAAETIFASLPTTLQSVTFYYSSGLESVALQAATLLQTYAERCQPPRPRIELHWRSYVSTGPTFMLPSFDDIRGKGLVMLTMAEAETTAGVRGKELTTGEDEQYALRHYLEAEEPHVLILIEVDMTEDEMRSNRDLDCLFERYRFVYCGGKARVALFSKFEALNVEYGLGGKGGVKFPVGEAETRAVTLELKEFYLLATYVPNSGTKFANIERRKEWNEDFGKWIKLLDEHKPVIWSGDFNVVRVASDKQRWSPDLELNSKCFNNAAGTHPDELAAHEALLNPPTLLNRNGGRVQGRRFVDIWRLIKGEQTREYT